MEHILFILFILLGTVSFVFSFLAGIKERDGLYCIISMAPLSIAIGSAYWYSLFLG